MDFSNLILEKIGSFVEEYNFRIVEERSYYLKLQSNNLIIVAVHNEMENTNTLWLGKNEKSNVEIDNEILTFFFHSDLKLSQVSVLTFVDNLALFLKNEAQPLLNGVTGKFAELEEFDLNRSKKYTADLLISQTLEIADKAWEADDYTNFVKTMDRMTISKMPQSYQLKYKIAKQKL